MNEKERRSICNYDKELMLKESKNTLSVLSNPYLSRGHCLVIPKQHYNNILEVLDEILLELIIEVRELERILLENLKVQGVDIRQNYRPFLRNNPNTHFHFHLIPRELYDDLWKISMVHQRYIYKNLDKDLLEELINLLTE